MMIRALRRGFFPLAASFLERAEAVARGAVPDGGKKRGEENPRLRFKRFPADYLRKFGRLKFAIIGANVDATSDMTVISVLIDGPAVSLKGSPTVSPMTPDL